MAEYGFLDTDVIFVEICYNDEWVFELDMNNPKYFGARVETPSEPVNYHRYWEVMNHRPFSTNESKVPPVPEYNRIMECIQHKELAEGTNRREKVLVPGVEKMRDLEVKMEPTVASEANVTNEASEAIEINKDLDVRKNVAEAIRTNLVIEIKRELCVGSTVQVHEKIKVCENIVKTEDCTAKSDKLASEGEDNVKNGKSTLNRSKV